MDLRITQTVKAFSYKIKELPTLEGKRETLTGSLSEGGFSASFFNKNDPKVPYIDIDLGIKGLGYINKKNRHWIRNIKNKTGFLNIKIAKAEEVYFKELITTYDNNNIDYIDKDGLVKTYKLKDLLRLTTKLKPRRNKFIAATLLDIAMNRIAIEDSNIVTKSTFEHTSNVYIDGQLKAVIHVDMSILLQLDWPCPYYETWLKRERLWPDLELLSEELKTSYVIAKTSKEEKNNKEATELQYSFTHLESKIMSLLSPNQRTVFYTTKIIFKQWIKPYSEAYLPSFLIKNIILWTCEQNPPHHPLWSFEFEDNFLNTLRYMFVKLKKHIEDGFFAYYFIPQINLIEGLPEELSQEVIATLEDIILNIKNYLPDEESRDRVENWMESMNFTMYRAMEFYKDCETYGGYTAALMFRKHTLNNIKEYIDDKDGHGGIHDHWKEFLSDKKPKT